MGILKMKRSLPSERGIFLNIRMKTAKELVAKSDMSNHGKSSLNGLANKNKIQQLSKL